MKMAKITSWGFTRLRGKVKDAEFRERKNKVIELSKKRVPSNPRTDAQKTIRSAYGKCVEKWNKLSYDEKLSWRAIGNSLKMSGYNAYMRQCISEALGWTGYEITIDNTGNANTLTEFQVLLNVSGDATFFEDCENNQVYLEFYDEDQTTLLKHWVQEWDTTNHNARIWIKVPSIPGSATKKIYLKINKGRTEDLSNGEDTFMLFDDFEDGVIDTDKWNVKDSANTVEENGYLRLGGGGPIPAVQSQDTFSDYILEGKVRMGDTTEFDEWFIWIAYKDDDNYYVHRHVPGHPTSSQRHNLAKRVGGSYTTLNYVNYTTADTEWHRFKAIVADSGLKKIDFEDLPDLEADDTSLTSPFSIELGGTTNSGHYAYYDIVFIRKYASPEPSVSYTKM